MPIDSKEREPCIYKVGRSLLDGLGMEWPKEMVACLGNLL